jgi:predicted N-acetyltransferase YhbS
MSTPADVSIRTMTLDDVPAGLALCRASRWNQTERDWKEFLNTAPNGSLVAVEHGTVVGTVATLPYGPFTWISMVLVAPAMRGRGIGTMLLTRGLALVPGGSAARLDATPAGEVLYRKLGFVAEYRLARLFLDVLPSRSPARGVRPLAPGDWPALLASDATAFGASRAGLLHRLAADAPEYAWVAEDEGRLRGYVFGRHGHVREQLGPLVADGADTAAALLDACLTAHPDRPVFIDVPDAQPAFRNALIDLGFAIERPFLRMHLEPLTAAGRPSAVYAITGPEFG